MPIKVCVAGATGWTGSAVTRGVLRSSEFELVSAVARKSAGQDVGDALDLKRKTGVVVSGTLEEALRAGPDVLIDYTSAKLVKAHTFEALAKGISIVVGTSGLTASDFEEIDDRATECGVGVIGGGNFSITAALLQNCARLAAAHLPHFEVLDFAWADKEDVPSGTARELAEVLSSVQRPKYAKSADEFVGPTEARGADIDGVQVHSLRVPGYTLRCEAVFGMEGEKLTIVHEAGPSAEPYVNGTLLAASKVQGVTGLVRGIDKLILED